MRVVDDPWHLQQIGAHVWAAQAVCSDRKIRVANGSEVTRIRALLHDRQAFFDSFVCGARTGAVAVVQ